MDSNPQNIGLNDKVRVDLEGHPWHCRPGQVTEVLSTEGHPPLGGVMVYFDPQEGAGGGTYLFLFSELEKVT